MANGMILYVFWYLVAMATSLFLLGKNNHAWVVVFLFSSLVFALAMIDFVQRINDELTKKKEQINKLEKLIFSDSFTYMSYHSMTSLVFGIVEAYISDTNSNHLENLGEITCQNEKIRKVFKEVIQTIRLRTIEELNKELSKGEEKNTFEVNVISLKLIALNELMDKIQKDEDKEIVSFAETLDLVL